MGTIDFGWMLKSSAKFQERPGENFGIPNKPLNFFEIVVSMAWHLCNLAAASVAVTLYRKEHGPWDAKAVELHQIHC